MICSKCKTKETNSTSGMCWWCINNAEVVNVKTVMPSFRVQDGVTQEWMQEINNNRDIDGVKGK